MNTPREWEKEFEQFFNWDKEGYGDDMAIFRATLLDLKSFIRIIEDKAREAERERVRKLVEGKREYVFCGKDTFKADSGLDCGVFLWKRDLLEALDTQKNSDNK